MSEVHAITKPHIFISHAASDGEFASAVKAEIEKVFANGVMVFCTSAPGTVEASQDWLSAIEDRLSKAQAVIAIITPLSIERSWLWFEVGATWLKARSGGCRIYPLCVAEVSLSDLPSPLDRLQALSLGRAIDLKLLFEALVGQFGFGSIAAFRASNITKRVPQYKNVKIKQEDLVVRAFYSGRYTGYSDDELMEVLDTNFVRPAYDQSGYDMKFGGREKNLYNGKLVHFREVDKNLELPPGTSRRLLVPVAERYRLLPSQITDNTVRFEYSEPDEKEGA